MGDGERAVVEVADRERRARDRLVDPELAAGAPDERRLARAELARTRTTSPGRSSRATAPPNASVSAAERRRRARSRLEVTRQKRPSWTATPGGASCPCGMRHGSGGARERIPAGRRLRRRPAEQARDAGEVLLQRPQHRRRVEGGGGMVERVEEHGRGRERDLVLLAVHLRDPERPAREEPRREVPERGDDAGADQLDLAEQVRLAGRDLALERVAVLRRPALEDVREVDLVPAEADAREEPLEQLTGLARERVARSDPRGTRAPRRRASARASGSPAPKTTWPRVAASGQRSQPAVSAA